MQNLQPQCCDNCLSGSAEFTVSLPGGLQEWCHECAAELLLTNQTEDHGLDKCEHNTSGSR